MTNVYIQESYPNSSEGRLWLTFGPKKTSVRIGDDVRYWRDSDSSRAAALATLQWFCELHGYTLIS